MTQDANSHTYIKTSGALGEDWFETYNHLGSHYPCYRRSDASRKFYPNAGLLLENDLNRSREIDPAGVLEMLSTSFMLGNRTLVADIAHVPWMAKPDGQDNWEYFAIPEHANRNMSFEEIAQKLKNLLIAEVQQYLNGKKRVGILLSGGMDSRILAGIIKDIQLKKEFSGDIVAFTWGLKNTRDVVYASQIARDYNWPWVHLELTPEMLEQNIYISGKSGAEFAPFHLHTMPSIRDQNNLDAIIAGSYGDSVGRAEYSGKHVLSLKPMLQKSQINRLGLLRHNVVKASYNNVFNDAYGYKRHVNRPEQYQYYEIENELHYMRRKLQACMSHIAEKIPCYQIFTHPETFGFMWGLDPKNRTDDIYKELLLLLPGGLGEIPWARTGKPYLQKESTSATDGYSSKHHTYGVWLRQDLRNTILSLVDSDTIRGLGLFNEKALDRMLKLWPQSATETTNAIDEAISWLASLSVFVETYKIRGCNNVFATSVKDNFFGWKGYLYACAYQKARAKYRQ